ncbi:hypothetical protein [Ligilactobacillus murinus]|nr:hypothetical protein [Ligilactobacillus murinus]
MAKKLPSDKKAKGKTGWGYQTRNKINSLLTMIIDYDQTNP